MRHRVKDDKCEGNFTIMTQQIKKIAITGASGFIGSNFIESLRSTSPQLEIHALTSRRVDFGSPKVKSFQGSLEDRDLSTAFLEGVECVFHFAFRGFPSENLPFPEKEILSNLETTALLFSAMRASKVSKLVIAGSGGAVYSPGADSRQNEASPTLANTAYATGKLCIELLSEMNRELYGIETYNFRISNVYGPGQSVRVQSGFIAKALSCALNNQPLPLWIDPATQKDFIYIEDVFNAFRMILTEKNLAPGIYNLGGGRSYSLSQVLSVIEKVTGVKVQVSKSENKPALTKNTSLDIFKFKNAAKWKPETSLENGIASFWEWMQSPTKKRRAA